jgi:tripartite-type tricarboxylate transporter receptor subunit TctC
VVEKLNTEINAVLRLPEVMATYEKLGPEITPSSASEFAAFVAKEAKKWPPIIKATGVTMQ